MKEIKSFYASDRLNRGYKADSKDKVNVVQNKDKDDVRTQYSYLLPPTDVISAYEEYYPGTLKQLLELAEKEQQHRHAYEDASLKIHERTVRLGQLCSLFLIVIISYITLSLSRSSITHSLIFASISFGSIFALSLFNHFRKDNKDSKQVYSFRNRNKNYFKK